MNGTGVYKTVQQSRFRHDAFYRFREERAVAEAYAKSMRECSLADGYAGLPSGFTRLTDMFRR